MGPGFRAPAVGRFMEIVRAWALHAWPMTRAQGIATYKALGWVRADDDIESFTTDCTAGARNPGPMRCLRSRGFQMSRGRSSSGGGRAPPTM